MEVRNVNYEAGNLPVEAFVQFSVDDEDEINDAWLKSADDHYKVTAIRAWFRARFCDAGVYSQCDDVSEHRFADGGL